jgi:Mn-dependent DtxR family transcriptional regulator
MIKEKKKGYIGYSGPVTKIKEDIYVRKLAESLKVSEHLVHKIVQKYKLGYLRPGAGKFIFLTKNDIKIIKERLKKFTFKKIYNL